MAQVIVGLDLGSYSVKVVRVAPQRGGEFEVLDADEVPLLSGAPEELPERQEVALRELKARGALSGDLVVTGLPGDVAATRVLTFPFTDARKIEQTLPFELEAEIPFDLDEIVLSWNIIGQGFDEEGNKTTDVQVSYARHEAVAARLALLETVEIDPRHVVYQPFALDALFQGVFDHHKEALVPGQATRTPGGTVIQLGDDGAVPAIALVDIGKRQTTVAIITEERVISGHTILHGGDDATRGLARELGLPLEEAERGKRKEAFIEVMGAKAQFPQQTQISNILKKAYAPIGRRLRHIFQSDLSQHRARVVRVVLTGGGARIINLDRHLGEVLNVRVARGDALNTQLGSGAVPISEDGTSAPQMAIATSYALAGFYGPKTRSFLDLRTGDFAWKGELDFLRDKAIAFGTWAVVIVAALLVTGIAQAWIYSSQAGELEDKQRAACKTITGQDIDSPTRCLAIIQETIGAQTETGVPTWSATDTYIEVSKRMPEANVLQRKVSDLDINTERVRLKATTSDFDAVDKVVTALSLGKCFNSVEKGKARNTKEGVEFDVVIRLDCDAKPKGEADPEWLTSVPTGTVAPKTKLRRPTPKVKKAAPPPVERPKKTSRDDMMKEMIEKARGSGEDADERAKAREERRKKWEERKAKARERARSRALERAKEDAKLAPQERIERMRARGLEPFNGIRRKKNGELIEPEAADASRFDDEEDEDEEQ